MLRLRHVIHNLPTFQVLSNDGYRLFPVAAVMTSCQRMLASAAATSKNSLSSRTTSSAQKISQMTNEQLADTSTIPGWDLIHSPPRKFPRGALIGIVVSDKMDKTVNVAVDRYKIVPRIHKRLRYTKKFMAHDENEVATMGDLVMITPCHRISKNKHFMLREIMRPKGLL